MTTDVRPALLWDVGGVLYRHFTEILLDLAPDRGWNLVGVPLGPAGTSPDEPYDRMQRGELTEQDYRVEVRRRLSSGGVDVDPVEACDFTDERRLEAWTLLQRAHDAGHAQAVVADDPASWLGSRLDTDWEPAAWVDVVLDVADLEEPPPAPAAYVLAANRLGVDPDDCLLVDDRRAHCAAADTLGMDSHWVDVRDAAASMRDLADRLQLDGAAVPEGTAGHP